MSIYQICDVLLMLTNLQLCEATGDWAGQELQVQVQVCSRQYLAFEGIYPPFWAAFPNNPTLGKHLVEQRIRSRRGSHPL